MGDPYLRVVDFPVDTQVVNIVGSSKDKRQKSWINYWSLKTNIYSACGGVCPLEHNPPNINIAGTINICRSIGGHVKILNDATNRWFILPICVYHNGQEGVTFTVKTAMKAVEISPK